MVRIFANGKEVTKEELEGYEIKSEEVKSIFERKLRKEEGRHDDKTWVAGM